MTRTLNTRIAALCGLVACALAIGASATSQAASTSTSVVGATVLSSTTIDAAACASGILGRTDFGPVTAGSSNVTTLDCDIRFGSSNNTAQLRVRQGDAFGQAMFSPTRGTLDTSFSGDGRVNTGYQPGVSGDYGNAVLVQSDGRVLTIGDCDTGGPTGWDACVARHNADGSLDTTFDTDGIVVTATAPGAGNDRANAGVIQPDGKIVTAGNCSMGGATGRDFCLARYNIDGSLDTTFDTDGRVTTAIAPTTGDDGAGSISLQADGTIVAAGGCAMGGATGSDACLVRYNIDGSLDTTFDTDGRVTTAMAPGAAGDAASGLAIQTDGRIVVSGGCAMGGATGGDFCVARHDSSGSLDTSFDTDGIATATIAPGTGYDYGADLVVQPDGRIVVAGACDMNGAANWDACAARFLTTGVLDTSFDGDGTTTAPIGPGPVFDYPEEVALQPDGKIVVGGYCESGGTTGEDACLIRFDSAGAVDSSFGNNGRVLTPLSLEPWWTDFVNDMVIAPDGRILLIGYCDMNTGTGYDMCVAAYAANGTLEQYTDDGVRDWDTAGAAPSLFGACLRTVSGGASAQWATSATCPATDGAYWNDVPVASERIAYTTALEPDPPDATASLRFGLRAAGSQPAGAYLAPITFDVLAPNV